MYTSIARPPRPSALFFLPVLVLLLLGPGRAFSGQSVPVAEEDRDAGQINFRPLVECVGFTLKVSGPGEVFWTQKFERGATPFISLDRATPPLPDGQYRYELVAEPAVDPVVRATGEAGRGASEPAAGGPLPVSPWEPLSGYFLVDGGRIVVSDVAEPAAAPEAGAGQILPYDVVHADDAIVTGSLCIGFDCLTDGTESFGFDTLKTKENSLRLFFDDTSTTAGFPANDWRIVANDSGSGGASYFAIEDSTAARFPFSIAAGAPAGSLFVDTSGRVGLKTTTPVLELHLADGDSPGVRLEQNTSAGWTAQTYDIVGNESNFFIRDTTAGSRLPFRLQPGAPTNALTIKSGGAIGMGTWSPEYPLEVERTGENATIVAHRTDGVAISLKATASYGNIGTLTNHALRLVTGSVPRMTVNTDNSLTMANGARLTAGGVWTDASSRLLKENIVGLTVEEALAALAALSPVKFTYKADASEDYVGFIAEEVPALVATRERTGVSPMDIVAVLAKVAQEQQRTIQTLAEKVRQLESR